MKEETAARLRQLNQQFYEQVADSFADSRERPQPGFALLLAWLPQPCQDVLDVGCGNGRFGQFLHKNGHPVTYTGVDNSIGLLTHARQLLPQGTFQQADMTCPGFLEGFGQFDLIVCLAAMQHIPGQANRARLLAEMADHLTENGRLFLANWQFMNSPRQRRKVRDWSMVGLSAGDVEPNDYLLTWQREGFGLRYVCQIDAEETAVLAQTANLNILHQFRSDGKEGNLSLYTVMAKTKAKD
ncbi:MAG: hypothetical protein Kow0080_03080 [Candidatus Promineifilaceae bacterium]